MDIEMLAVVGLDTRGYWRSLTKGHLKRCIDLTVKFDQVFVNYLYQSTGNGC